MHTAECDGSDWEEWWPQGAVKQDVSALSTSGQSDPLRIPEKFNAPWLGIWTDRAGMSGLRIAVSTSESFPVDAGIAIPWPKGVDLFLLKDTGGTGNAYFARFKTRESAEAFTRASIAAIRGGGAALGPFPAASALADSDPNPTTTRLGSNLLVFNGTTWDRARATTPADALAALEALAVLAFPALWNGTNFDRAQSIPVSASGRAKVQDTFDQVTSVTVLNTGSTGLTTMYTAPAGKVATIYEFIYQNAFTAAATFKLQRSGAMFDTYTTTGVNEIARAVGPIIIGAGNTLEANVTAAGAGSVNLMHMIQERYVS